ncbi:sodium:solute symporter family protein [Cardinium endosymbiont of Nabis limbatus]|uniref:sodium:solute symporter family protein n=1 Tax=Cardinium endosymbiont of Nabis limbatus TaxID=3066217 RepID=UPI003AF362B5
MILYTFPLLMVLAFLLLTLLLGLYVSKKEITYREYAVGNKRFHTTTLVFTVLATTFGGGIIMSGVPNIYAIGMKFIVFSFIMALVFYTISLLGLRMGAFMKHFSIAETIGSIYGKYPRAIAAVLGTCLSIAVVTIQINVMSFAIGMCIDSINPRTLTVLATLVLIAYAMLGGVRAIAITDVLQCITFIVIMALLIKFLFIKTGKSFLEVVLLLQQQEKFQFSSFFQVNRNLLMLVLNGLWLAFLLPIPAIQRVYTASSPIQAYKIFLRVTLFSIIIIGGVVSISLLIFIKNPTLLQTEIWPYILADMSPAYKGCIVICLLGMTMSTADSNLHAVSILVSHDIVECIRGIKVASHIHQLRLAKLTVLVTGLLAMIAAVYYPDIFQLCIYINSYIAVAFGDTVIPPFILAIFGFRGSSRTALIGMAVGILFDVAWDQWVKPEIEISAGCLPMVANGLAMMAAHYLLPQPEGKGWIGKNDQQKRMEQLIRAFKRYKKNIDLR